MKAMLVALSLVATLSPSLALAEHTVVPTLGFGSRHCKDWTSSRAAGGLTSALAAQWAYGYFSAYNAYGHGEGWFFSYDAPHLVDVIDQQCVLSPDKPIINVAYEFIRELTKNQKHHH